MTYSAYGGIDVYPISTYTLGPVTIVSYTTPLPSLTPPPTSDTQPVAPTTVTVDSTVTVATSSSTLIQPPCEFIIAVLSSMAFWLLALPVSSALLFSCSSRLDSLESDANMCQQ